MTNLIPSRSALRAVTAPLFCAILASGQVLAAAEEVTSAESAPTEFSQAEEALWMTNQLEMVEKPTLLRYQFDKTGTLEEGFSDVVELKITEVKDDGMKAAEVTFFTGERNHFVPPNENTAVNPVLGIYLQGDVYEMDRLTPGGWRYFHRQLKHAFSDTAEVEPVTVEFAGQPRQALQIRVQPYVNDPHRNEMQEFADKEYVFIVSDELPGYLYEVYTRVQPDEGGEPLVEERLRLVATESL